MKMLCARVVALLAYYCGLDALFYWLNRRAKRIITFHNVLPDAIFREGVANGVSSTLSCFEKIVDECRKRFEFSTDLFDAKTLTITFDDGYRNQYSVAFKSLQRRGIPAYLFVSGDCLEDKELVVDLLTHWIDNVPCGVYKLDLDGACKACEIVSSNRAQVWEDVLWPLFICDGANFGRSVLAACDRAYPIQKILQALPEEYVAERLRGISSKECEEMRSAGWKIGWHTRSHYPLAKLDADKVKSELDAPAEFRNVCLSYPYGNPSEVGDAAVKLAESLGYPCAVSNTNTVAENKSKYFLPRVALSSDKYRFHFELSGCGYFIRHLRLLPKMACK